MWELVFLIIVVLATFGVTVWVLVDCYQKSNCLETASSVLNSGGTSGGTSGGNSGGASVDGEAVYTQDGFNYQSHQSHLTRQNQHIPAGLSLQPDPQGCVVEGTEAKQFKLANHETGAVGMHLESDGANFQTSVVVGQTEVFFMPLPPGESAVDCEFDVVEGDVVTVTVRNSTRQRMRLVNCTLTSA
jgi:hypothetical protein